ncbi:ABC transporter permease [Staphylococcus kloosii]|uniref:ABC transporter permease n=1 Tax=Staphylococcus kloosii TaxID=29384 RepID=UPI00189D7D15|nr:ABC transporter permease [Staphylococcus kloosii]MBF7023503.1 ABC transporter permease [Staphylococcus kloosii]MBF7028601.1 ABC transporter permease [Staphylococcus kloosii]
MKSVYIVLKEHIKNIYLIKRLADFQLRISNHSNYLGLGWELINPAFQILIYWFVFGLGVRQNSSVEGVPFIFWLLVGISMWFFVNQGVLDGTKAITTKYRQVSKMNFPLSILPSYTVFSKFYAHILLLVVVMIICLTGGYHPTIYTLQLLIYIPYALLLTMSIALLTSTLSLLIRDLQMAMQAFMRIIFFVSSILYPANSAIVATVMKLNPIYFLAESYRAAILHREWYFITHWHLAVYNIALVLIIFIVGSILHMRYRDTFDDYM